MQELNEGLDLDLDLDLHLQALSERGHGSHSPAGHGEVGERLLAARTRVGNPEDLAHAVSEALRALRAGGWNGETVPVGVILDTEHDDGVPGREFALRGAIGDARIVVPAENPDPEAARGAFAAAVPEGAVTFSAHKGEGLAVDIRYLSPGHADPADDDMRRALLAAGVKVGC